MKGRAAREGTNRLGAERTPLTGIIVPMSGFLAAVLVLALMALAIVAALRYFKQFETIEPTP